MKTGAVLTNGVFMACCLTYATLLGATTGAQNGQASISTLIVQHEKATLEAFKTHDKKSYARLCLPGFYEITSGGTINTLEDELRELDDYVLGEYRMEDVVVTVLSSTAALIRYRISARYTYKGKPLPVETMLASAVWVRRGNDWKAATYQEVKAQTPR
jgi:hypothetical protein